MSAREVTDKLVDAIENKAFDVIICNYANADMVGHTGNFVATVKAIETLDACLARVLDALAKAGGEALITADHGNAEVMIDKTTGDKHTAHTINPVPCIVTLAPDVKLRESGTLADLAPTVLQLFGLPETEKMKGRGLVL